MQRSSSVLRGRALLVALVPLALTASAMQACTTDYQKGVDDPNFGAPNALAGATPPGTSSDSTLGDGGAGGAPECTKTGGAVVDGGACAVTLKTDIMGAFKAAGCTPATCHGGANPVAQPRIDDTAANEMWDTWQKFKLSNGKPYINPCSTDPATSTIACNVNAANKCGSLMPKGNPAGMPADIVGKIDTWLKCGSPDN